MRCESIVLGMDRLELSPLPQATPVEYDLFADLRHRDDQADLHHWGFTIQHRGIDGAYRDLVRRAGARTDLPKVVGSHRMSWGIAATVVLPFVVWTDLRFRITVVEADGTPVEVDPKGFHFHRPPRSYFQGFHYGYGNRLKKGVVYFGFCQWVRHREDWSIFGDAGPPGGGRIRGSLALTDGGWEKWPMRITVPPGVP